MTQGHSPLGFSGAERYFNCAGSPALIAALPPEAILPDPDYTKAGVAAHAAWAECLREGLDTWEVAHLEWEGVKLTEDDLKAGQVYLDAVRPIPRPGALEVLVEWFHHAPAIHEQAYSTLDLAVIGGNFAEITDYKHGEGIYVKAERNLQLMGYAALLLDAYPHLCYFYLRIVQPRCQPYQGPSEWEISADDLRTWIETELKPAMDRSSEYLRNPDRHAVPIKAGPWCRFCPVQKALACPEHNKLPAIIEQGAPEVERLSDERLGDLYAKVEPLKMMMNSITAEVLRRRLAGVDVPNSKTVQKKVFRVWKDGAEEALSAALGPCVMKTELKGPAEMEKLSKLAKQLTKEYAFSPDAGYTVAPIGDRRKAIDVVPADATCFDKYIDKGEDFE